MSVHTSVESIQNHLPKFPDLWMHAEQPDDFDLTSSEAVQVYERLHLINRQQTIAILEPTEQDFLLLEQSN